MPGQTITHHFDGENVEIAKDISAIPCEKRQPCGIGAMYQRLGDPPQRQQKIPVDPAMAMIAKIAKN